MSTPEKSELSLPEKILASVCMYGALILAAVAYYKFNHVK